MKPKKDYRSPLAKARDEWFESEAGKNALSSVFGPGEYLSVSAQRYLRNRLESAYLAGANDMEQIKDAKLNRMARKGAKCPQ